MKFDRRCLPVNYETRKTNLSVPGFGDYMLLKRIDNRLASLNVLFALMLAS
jgi:hypothetical protein